MAFRYIVISLMNTEKERGPISHMLGVYHTFCHALKMPVANEKDKAFLFLFLFLPLNETVGLWTLMEIH